MTRRAARTLWLGLLLGLAGGVSIVASTALTRDGAGVLLDPALPGALATPALHALPALTDGPEWRCVVQAGTPWGEMARLRPFVAGIEVRGADCVLQRGPDGDRGGEGRGADGRGGSADPGAGAWSARFERDPAAVDWPALRRGLAPLAKARYDADPAGIARRLGLRGPAIAGTGAPGDAGGDGNRDGGDIAGSAEGSEPPRGGARSYASPGPQAALVSAPRLFVTLRDGRDGPFALEAELTVRGQAEALASIFAPLPWAGPAGDEKAAPASGPFDLRLTLDPATLEIVDVRDGRISSGGTALIFDPNPVATSGRTDLRDGDPVDIWRVLVPLRGLDGSGRLRGVRVEALTDLPPRAEEPAGHFAYPSHDPRFEETMIYAHGDRAIARAESLGFTGLFRTPLRLRAHGTAADNSWYSRPTREIVFGDGGVDDAEDADIILHETAHAVHDALVPGFGDGDTRAIGEGFADFWAASLTGDACLGDWDATSYAPPCLRRADEPAVWPAWLEGRPHHDGQIWSALLWDLRALLGRDDAERLALAALLEQDTRTTWSEAARGLVRAAGRLGLDERLPEIRQAIGGRGLGPREVAAVLGPDDSRRIDLLAPALFLGRSAAGLVIQGDGRILFPETGGSMEARPFPQGPPCVAPCAREVEGDVSDDALRLDFHLRQEGAEVTLLFRWIDGAGEAARVAAVWDWVDGSFEWTYEAARDDGAAEFYAGAAVGAGAEDPVAYLSLAELPEGGVGGLRAFRTELGGGPLREARGFPAGTRAGEITTGATGLASIVGARFRIEEEAGAFGLRGRAHPLAPAGERPVLAVQPNPCRSVAEIRLRLPRSAQASVALLDVLGRRVRLLHAGASPEGVTNLRWDGRDDGGRPLPNGFYWVRAEAGGANAAVRLLLIR